MGYRRQYQSHCEHDQLPGYVENAAVALARDGSHLYGVSELSRADNGDMIATVADTSTTDDTTAPYSFIKYAVHPLHHSDSLAIAGSGCSGNSQKAPSYKEKYNINKTSLKSASTVGLQFASLP